MTLVLEHGPPLRGLGLSEQTWVARLDALEGLVEDPLHVGFLVEVFELFLQPVDPVHKLLLLCLLFGNREASYRLGLLEHPLPRILSGAFLT